MGLGRRELQTGRKWGVGGRGKGVKASQCLKLDSKVLSLVPAPVPITQFGESQGSVMGGGGGGAGEPSGSSCLQMQASEGSVGMVSKGV